jgi:FkbM family methyltransferase
MFRRLLRTIVRFVRVSEVQYQDPYGYVRSADLRDRMESLGYFGAKLGINDGLPAAAANLVRPGDWVIDVGANIGLVAGQLCSIVGALGEVWAVEPIRRNVDRLHQLKTHNRLDQLQIVVGALSDQTGHAQISLPVEGESGWGSFARDFRGTYVQVPIWRLDDLVDPSNSRELRLIKIDVEGHEPAVLRGAVNTLRTRRPRIYCEFNDPLLRAAGSSADQLLQSFADVGYSVIWPLKLPNMAMLVRDLLLGPSP